MRDSELQGVGRRLEVSCIIGEVRDYTGIGSKSAEWRDGGMEENWWR